MHYLLFYDVGPDYLEKRALYRTEHLDLAWKSHEAGKLILGGAFADPVDGALLLFNGESPDVAEQFAIHDPYVKNGLVMEWRVRPWTTVVGENAATPLRPGT